MPAELPPYMNAYGNIAKILEKIKVAATPPRFTTDFLGTELGFTGGSATPFISFAKRLGLIGSDGTPTELYRRFRNQEQSRFAMAEAIRKGYPELYRRNEYVHSLEKGALGGLVAEATGLENSSPQLRAIVQSFLTLKNFADFSDVGKPSAEEKRDVNIAKPDQSKIIDEEGSLAHNYRLSYTITLNLPNTNDISVFNAIFKALKEHLG